MSILGVLAGAFFGWGAELFVEVVNKITDKKKPLPPPVLPDDYDSTTFKLVKEADEFVTVEEFIENLDKFKTEKIKVYSIPEGDVLEVTFKNGLKNKILTSSFSTSLENIDFASQINSYIETHRSRIVGVKIVKVDDQNYNIAFRFEEIE